MKFSVKRLVLAAVLALPVASLIVPPAMAKNQSNWPSETQTQKPKASKTQTKSTAKKSGTQKSGTQKAKAKPATKKPTTAAG